MSLRSDRKTCRGCGAFLLIGDEDLCEVCSDHLRDPCPMGCGNQTEDVAGGPCKECWELVDRTNAGAPAPAHVVGRTS